MTVLFRFLRILLLALSTTVISSRATTKNKKHDDIPSRVEALLQTMTLEQKIAQTFAAHTPETVFRPVLQSKGVGCVKLAGILGHGKSHNITSLVRARNQLQKDFLQSTGIPISFVNEGNHGAMGGTIFPMPVGQGCSWNTSLIYEIASVIAKESSAVGVDTVFAPVVNMVTDPRFGRGQECFSENPILTTHLGAASVLGLQQKLKQGEYLDPNAVAALGKHFAAYGDSAGGLNGGPSFASERMLFDVFFRPWKAMAKAGMKALMPAHNTVQHIPCHANKWLLQTIMRDTFGFRGVMLTDCSDINVLEDFRVAANTSHAAALALRAGVDWDLQCSKDPNEWYYSYLKEALEEQLITRADIDATVRRILTHKFEVGLFDDRAFVDEQRAARILDNPKHRALAREAAEQSIVLLINRNKTLPISFADDAPESIALLGPTASSECKCAAATESLMGSYSFPGARVVTLDEALQKVIPSTTEVKWERGCQGSGPTGSGINETEIARAVALAKDADLTILVLGDIEGGCGEWGDRDSLDLQGSQLALLEAVAPIAKKTVVILVHGRPQTFGEKNAVLNDVDAMFAAWRPGEEFGNAMVRLISGQVNPSAKLSQSWPRTVGHVGSGSVPWLQEVRGKWVANRRGPEDADGRRYDGYVSSAFDPRPLFYFGHGLSYAEFNYESMKVLDSADPDTVWEVEISISNEGLQDGVEVVQVYVEDPVGLPYVPFWKRLVGFTRCSVPVSSRTTCLVSVSVDDLAIYSPHSHDNMEVYSGAYVIRAGGSSNSDHLKKEVSLNASNLLSSQAMDK